MGKRKRVPEVLWRMFGNSARTLSETIISLIPQHCDCHGRGKCLRCVFGVGDEAAMAYLIRPDDLEEYRQLMMKCFVVVPTDAPPLPPLLSFSVRWSQPQIVERTIETLSSKQAANANVICSGYEKSKMSSSIAKLLTCSIWDLAWRRVGDNLMGYLLMHALIFMPIKHKGHQQVTGPPANSKFLGFPTARPDTMPSIYSRHQRKRTRADGNDSAYGVPQSEAPFKSGQLNSFDCIGSMIGDYVGTKYFEMNSLLHSSGTARLSNNPGSSKMVIRNEHSVELEVNRRNRVRLPSWQRRKRCKRSTQQDADSEEPFTKVANDRGDLCNACQCNMPLLCPCCSAFQSLSPVPKDVQIKRTSMLYSMECSSSLFLKCHIVYSLNPRLAGARDLLRRIFGLSSIEKLSKPASCFDGLQFCSHGSPCLYHSLIKLLKVFLHRAKRCQHLRLLKKHCSVQPFSSLSGKGTSSILQRSKMESELASSRQSADLEGNQPVKKSLYDDSRDCSRTSEITQQQFGLPKPYCQNDDVVSFVWAVCRNITPPQLLGGPSFQRILRKNICRFIKLRRFEKFSLKQCMHRLEISKFPLLSNKHSFSCSNAFTVKHGTEEQIHQLQPHHSPNICHCDIKQILLERWIFWFFAHIVVPVVQANFYVTESEHGKQNLYFYRKSVWKKLSDRVFVQLEGSIYRSLCSSSVRNLLSKRSFGFSKVRLCPKDTGARPIANLKTASRLGIWQLHSHAQIPQRKKKGRQQKRFHKVSYLKAVNTVLRDLHVIFKNVRIKEPGKWGSSVSSYNDVYRKLCPFLMNLKKEQALMPCVYIVVSDVQKAFDTVSQDKLLSIVNEMQMADKYTLLKSCEIFCRKKFVWVSENLKLVTQSTDTGLAESIPLVRRRSGHTILLSKDHSKTVKTNELKSILEEHLKCNVLKLGKRFFRQIVGIPQGSVLSSLLCSLYYGHLEKHAIFPLLAKGANGMLDQAANSHTALAARQHAYSSSPKYLLLRFVDDFLFLSTSKKQATSFLSRLHRGFREYNCYMNPEKFGINFHAGCMSWLDSKRTIVGSDGASFLCWSGLLINSCSLEVQVDYTRYLHDHLSSTLTVSWEGRPDRQLKAKLCAYMRPKCHPVFFDATINSPATIRLNIYQSFMLCAMKFHCYVRELSSVHKLRPRSCFTSIEGSIRYMYNLMKRRMYAISRGSDCQPVLQVAKEEVRWLGLTAYVRVLKRKQSRYKVLLHLLRAALLPLSRIGSSSQLKYAVDDSHSSILRKIKY